MNKGQLKVGGKLATNNLDPANMPDGWGGGLRIFDGYSSGTMGFGPDGKKLNAYINKDGNMLGNNLTLNNNLNVTGKLLTPANHTIECAGRQHITGGEILYVLNKGGLTVGKEWGGSGDVNIQGNLSVAKLININGLNSRDITPIIINFNAPDIDHSFFNRTFIIPNQTFISILWQDNNGWDRFRWFQDRLKARNRDWRANVRHLEDFRRFRTITLTVPNGKQFKIYGWTGEFKKYGPGFYQETLPFNPHVIWGGWDEYVDDFPDNLHIANKTGM